jgi:diguanylate cyclase (GGDEF)-like protein/PAS domain S-box-containing protein
MRLQTSFTWRVAVPLGAMTLAAWWGWGAGLLESITFQWMAGGMGVALLIAAVAVRMVVLRPLRHMGEEMIEISEKADYARELAEAKRRDELGMAARCFNQLLSTVRDGRRRLEHRVSELEHANSELNAVRELSLDCIVCIDHQGCITAFNAAAQRVFGYTLEEVIGKSMADVLIPAHLREVHWQALRRTLSQGECVSAGKRIEVTGLRRDGVEVPLEVVLSMFQIDGKPRFAAYMKDIGRQRQEQQLQTDGIMVLEMIAQNQPITDVMGALVRLVERQLPGMAGCVMLRRNKRLEGVAAPSIAREFRLKIEDMERLPDPFSMLGPDCPRMELLAYIETNSSWEPLREEALRCGYKTCWVTPILSGMGELLGAFAAYLPEERQPTQAEIATLSMAVRKAAIAVERERLTERLSHQARHDLLTGLPNRLLLADRLQGALARSRRDGKPCALMYIDVDRFGAFNDSLGHKAGDVLLQQVSKRLLKGLRETDTLARTGSDEFALVLPGLTSAEDASLVAQKLLSSMLAPFSAGGREVFITLSVGIAVFPQDGQEAVLLEKCSDAALYQAKQAGRNQYRLYSPEMNAAVLDKLEMETHLRRALELGEFELYYQPKVNSAGRVIGFEGLLRWHSERFGMVPPMKFIPLAEESGLISSLGAWVVEEACRQMVQWRAQGFAPLPISVNVSVAQFGQSDFVEFVGRTLDGNGIEPQWLELEITESLLLHDAEETAAKLQQLRELGVGIAIDDFGTGYSSLAYLQKLPIDTLKIDRSFVREIGGQTMVIRAVISLAQSLRMKVIAEGVETPQQREFLSRLGCEGMQGYLFGKPVPAAEAAEMIKAGTLPLPVSQPLAKSA